ncbi:hypothetical protein D3C87_1806150 [compost metagenome]
MIPDIRMEIDSFEAIVRLLPTCKAAALLPKSYLRTPLLDKNEVVTIPMKELEQTRRRTCLIFGQKTDLNAETRQWISEMKKTLSSALSV